MNVLKNVCIDCLAGLLKLSCPWYLSRILYAALRQTLLLTCFVCMSVCLVLFPEVVHNPMHTVAPPEASVYVSETVEEEAWPVPSLPEPDFDTLFPVPDELTNQVEFWKRIFSTCTRQQAVLYDDWYFVVYEVVNSGVSPGVYARKRHYKNILRSLERKHQADDVDSLTPEEAEVSQKFEHFSGKDVFKKAATSRMNVHYGQRENFIEAIRRSGLYQEQFERIFHQYGLPLELTRIPFVESYFKYRAYSSAHAAGVWQFIPSTARLYGLRMNSKVDERYDPFKSADSAARLLRANYEMFGSWPLAITAYNHGNAGVQKAVRQLDTTDLGKIVRSYRSPTFGYYSRNYYAQVVAAMQVMQNPEQHFGRAIQALPALHYEQVLVKHPVLLKSLAAQLQVSQDALVILNRDLKRTVIQSKSPLPHNYIFKIPPGKKQRYLAQVKD